MRRIPVAGALLLAVLLLIAAGTFALDMRRAYVRVGGAGQTVATRYGAIEYTRGGHGPPVLVIHGAGGGYDQGQLLVEAVLGDDFHWITPSRFGYLGSAMPAAATWDDQAHAFALLLDELEVDRVAVVALSQGGASALLFALLYPERVSSLTCLSCGVVAAASGDQDDANRKGNLLRMIYSSDITYWPMSRFFRRQFMGVLGASRDVVAALTPEQRSIIERIVEYMNPASLRSAGVRMDNEAALPGERIAAVTAPTLIVHARDDLLQLYHNAEFAAATIPGARLLSFDAGGHVVIAVERATIRRAVREHILAHD
ncbi:MAG TPA: alpha/beta hydrolase [Longimicrobiales bacterium]|nr:alpha/beta hydrolase [Longimicrobiales bacterium]